MRPFHVLGGLFVTTLVACGVAVVDRNACDTTGSGGDSTTLTGGGGTGGDDGTTTSSGTVEGCAFEPCSNADTDLAGPKGPNECNTPEDAMCLVNQTDHVFECLQIKDPPACPEWVHVGEWVDGGLVWNEGYGGSVP